MTNRCQTRNGPSTHKPLSCGGHEQHVFLIIYFIFFSLDASQNKGIRNASLHFTAGTTEGGHLTGLDDMVLARITR
jgi:hypothetical protein